MIPARRRACLAAWALLLSSSACPAPARPPEPGALRLNLGTEPATLDWMLANDSVSFDVVGNLMDGLTRLGEDGRIEPALAERWTPSEDGLRLTFHLREGVRWTDGRPLSASDFVYAWRRLLAPATGAVYAYILHPIRGARAFNEGLESDPETVGVRAPDARTLEVEFERPASYFPGVTTFMAAFPAPRWAIETHGDGWTEPGAIVTLGPFALAAWRHDDEIDLRANPAYWGGAPPLRRVEMAMVEEASTALALFETGRLDFVDYRSLPVALLPRYIAGPGHLASPQLRTNYIGFNVTRPPFDDRRVRAAFAMALRRAVIPRVLRGGETPLRSLLPPGLLGHDPEIGLPEDAGRARALLAEAGYPGGEGFPPATLAYNTREDWRTLLEAVQAIWA
ncbi:MAG: peptide ABC transporter substrate-binding protein, partial [Candidatus Methylomirabilis sp.]|nr:peptide ABC transporter substrate-binding protein [Deltaproteobacteria bacterium]